MFSAIQEPSVMPLAILVTDNNSKARSGAGEPREFSGGTGCCILQQKIPCYVVFVPN